MKETILNSISTAALVFPVKGAHLWLPARFESLPIFTFVDKKTPNIPGIAGTFRFHFSTFALILKKKEKGGKRGNFSFKFCHPLTWLVEGRGELFGNQPGNTGFTVGSLSCLVSCIRLGLGVSRPVGWRCTELEMSHQHLHSNKLK